MKRRRRREKMSTKFALKYVEFFPTSKSSSHSSLTPYFRVTSSSFSYSFSGIGLIYNTRKRKVYNPQL